MRRMTECGEQFWRDFQGKQRIRALQGTIDGSFHNTFLKKTSLEQNMQKEKEC